MRKLKVESKLMDTKLTSFLKKIQLKFPGANLELTILLNAQVLSQKPKMLEVIYKEVLKRPSFLLHPKTALQSSSSE